MSSRPSDWPLYKRLLGYAAGQKRYLSLSLLGYLLFAATAAAMAWITGEIMQVLLEQDQQRYISLPLMLVGIFAIRGLGSFLGEYFLGMTSRQLVHQLRTQVFASLSTMPAQAYIQHSPGHLLAKITYHVEQLARACSNAISTSFREGLTVLVTLGFMLYIEWRLTLLFLVVMPLIALIVSMASRSFRRNAARIQHSMGDVNEIANETIHNYQVVRAFGQAQAEIERFARSSDENARQGVRLIWVKAISTPIIHILIAIGLALITYSTFLLGLDVEQFAKFFTAVVQIAKPIRQLTNVTQQIQVGLAAATDLFAQIDTPGEDNQGQVVRERVQGHLVFDQVSFRYTPATAPVIDRLNLTIEPGQRVAIVGKTGGGKSTLINLIPRFLNYDQGDIRLDGVSIQQYELTNLRSHIAIVGQQAQLFNGSIEYNIRYGRPNASAQQVLQAAQRAHVLEFVEQMPKGLQTAIGGQGASLSGGQRQRIAIARALLMDAPILILDEATSALDNESERLIQAALEEVMAHRTSIIIAHRLSTIEQADVICVMHQGRLVEQGSHAQLMQRKGAYYRLHSEGSMHEAIGGDGPAG